MKRGHEWSRMKAERPHVIRRHERSERLRVMPVARCIHCRAKRVLVEGPRGGPSLHYELKGELFWWAPKCNERPDPWVSAIAIARALDRRRRRK